jgi:hypothetical protein
VGEGRSFHGTPTTGGRRERRVTALLAVLLIGFVGVAIVKPWGSPVQPVPSFPPPRVDVTPPAPSLQTNGPEVPSPAPTGEVVTLPVAFTTPLASASASATWTGLTWRRLAPADPLGLVTSVVGWRRGFIAVGRIDVPPSTPVWTSADGTRWDVLPADTSSTFWPGHAVLAIAGLGTGLVAITETAEYCATPCALAFELPIVSWTSPDGRRWSPHVLPPEWLAEPAGQPPLVAVGPAGLIVASSGPAARLATSTDGSDWHLVPASGFPARFALNDLQGTASGYVAIGRWMPTESRREAVSLWSRDGRQWSGTPTILPRAPHAGSDVGSAGTSLVIGLDGMIAVGRGGTTPGAALWWQSANGRDWRPLPTFPPLGTTACPGDGCGPQPNGALVGDGQRMVAVRGGPDAGAWTSSDGLAWQRLHVAGDLPSEQATQAILLPGGVLLSDGTTTWFGEAQAP